MTRLSLTAATKPFPERKKKKFDADILNKNTPGRGDHRSGCMFYLIVFCQQPHESSSGRIPRQVSRKTRPLQHFLHLSRVPLRVQKLSCKVSQRTFVSSVHYCTFNCLLCTCTSCLPLLFPFCRSCCKCT